MNQNTEGRYEISRIFSRICAKFASALDEAHAHLQISVENSIPRGLIGNEQMLENVLTELLELSVKDGRNGGIQLRVDWDELDASYVFLVFSIEDVSTVWGEGVRQREQAIARELEELDSELVCEKDPVSGTNRYFSICQGIYDARSIGVWKGNEEQTDVPQLNTDPHISGVVWADALKYTTSHTAAEGYDNLWQYLDSAMRCQTLLLQAYEKRDATAYTIQAHAWKSLARLIGANHLSDTAKVQEMAGKTGHWEEIAANHENLLQENHKLVEAIQNVVEPNKKKQSAEK